MAPIDKKRRLTVLQNGNGGDEDGPPPEARSAREWIAITAAVTFIAWLLSAGLGNMAVQRLASESALAAIVVNVAALLFATGLAAYLLGRRGPRAEARHARFGVAITTVLGWALSYFQSGGAPSFPFWAMTLLVLLVTSHVGATFGFRFARRPPRRSGQRT